MEPAGHGQALVQDPQVSLGRGGPWRHCHFPGSRALQLLLHHHMATCDSMGSQGTACPPPGNTHLGDLTCLMHPSHPQCLSRIPFLSPGALQGAMQKPATSAIFLSAQMAPVGVWEVAEGCPGMGGGSPWRCADRWGFRKYKAVTLSGGASMCLGMLMFHCLLC